MLRNYKRMLQTLTRFSRRTLLTFTAALSLICVNILRESCCNFDLTYVPPSESHRIQYLIGGHEICSGVTDLDYIIYVYSSPGHSDRRQFIRNTWGKVNLIKGFTSRLVFVFGTTPNKTLTSNIHSESQKYGDIVQADFSDTYVALTTKALISIKWIATYCKKVKYVIKADDDVLLDIFTVAPTLPRVFGSHEAMKFHCHVIVEGDVLNNSYRKWFIKKKRKRLFGRLFEYAYPTYCSGPMYMYTRRVLLGIYNQTFHKPLDSRYEDVWVTGLLPLGLNATYIHTNVKIFTAKKPLDEDWSAIFAFPGSYWSEGAPSQWVHMLTKRRRQILDVTSPEVYSALINYFSTNQRKSMSSN